MKDQNKNSFVEFARGYHDSSHDKPSNDGSNPAVQLISLGIFGNSRENSNEYHDGFRKGTEDSKNRK
jgi:hypothetical protein